LTDANEPTFMLMYLSVHKIKFTAPLRDLYQKIIIFKMVFESRMIVLPLLA